MPVEANPEGFDVDEFLDALQPRTVTVRICGRRDLVARHTELEEQLAKAQRKPSHTIEGNPEVYELAEQISELENEIEAAHHEFKFESLGARAWADLLAKHPPTREHRQTTPGIDFNPDTFPAAAVAAASHNPKLSKAQARALEAQLTIAEWELLWGAALSANVGGETNPKSVLAGSILRRNERSENTHANEEYLDQSS